jgi:hypothetical protein
MVLVWETSMIEAVRTTASPAATWAIVVIVTILALFMAKVAMLMDLRVAREQRRERMLGIAPEAGDAWAMEAGSEWPRLSQALLAAAGVQPSEAADIRAGAPTADAAGRHDIPAQRAAPAEQPAPAAQRAEAAGYAGELGVEPPTVPIPAQRGQVASGAQGPREQQYAATGRHERSADPSVGETTRPDLPAQQAPGRHAAEMPRQRTGESDRAERSFAGPAPQDDDEDEQ